METNYSSFSKEPYQPQPGLNKPVTKESKVTKKDPFSVQQINLNSSDSDTESVEKTTATALQIIQQPQNKGEALKKLQEKVEIVYSSYQKKKPELAKKAALSLSHFISVIEKTDKITSPEKSSGFQHFKDEAGLKLEHYPDGKVRDIALLNVFLGEGSNKLIKLSVDLNSFKPIARSAVDISDINVERNLTKEIEIQNQLKGPGFLEILATCTYVGKDSIPKMGIITEYCQGGSLRSFSKGFFADIRPDVQDTYWKFAETLLSGLNKMAKMNICHGDLKPENLMLNLDDPSTMALKIADFGYANFIREKMVDVKLGGGTPNYLPPEFLIAMELKDLGMSKIEENNKEEGEALIAQAAQILINSKVDVWAAGLVLLELRSAFLAPMHELLNAEDTDDLFIKVGELKQEALDKFFSKADSSSKSEIKNIEDLIYQMLQVDPKNRISPEKALEAFQMLEKNNSNFCISEDTVLEWKDNLPSLIEEEIEDKTEETSL